MSRNLRTYFERVKDKGYVQGTITKRQVYADMTVYVSPTGSEQGDGSRDRPFGTIGQVCRFLGDYEANYNDVYIRFLSGTYTWNDWSHIDITGLKGWRQVYVLADTENAEDVVINSTLDGFQITQNDIAYLKIQSLTINAGGSYSCINFAGGNTIASAMIGWSGQKVIFGTGRYCLTNRGAKVSGYGTWEVIADKRSLVYISDKGHLASNWTAISIQCNFAVDATHGFIDIYEGSASLYGPIVVGEGFTLSGTNWLDFANGAWVLAYSNFTDTIPEGMGVEAYGPCMLNGYPIYSGKTVADLEGNGLATAGMLQWCTNEVGGACFVYYDGTNWKRMDNNNTISAT